eukprot:GGOE01003115.1.p2 GENE.GGOE01003115.1~~GGOE01003115.1.p2  ORF type:complete len:102 (+),score=18.31 GGOE01003115.1:32-337(+)
MVGHHGVKRPQAEVPYTRHNYPAEDLPPNWASIIALVLSVSGLLLRHKPLAWAGLLTCMGCLATTRYSRLDFKQMTTCVIFSAMGLVMNYAPLLRSAENPS